MTNQPTPQINDEAAFMSALGVDPGTVLSGSIKIEFQGGGQPVISWTTITTVDITALGAAMLAAGQSHAAPAGQPEETGRKQPQDRKKKRPAENAAAPREEEAGESAD